MMETGMYWSAQDPCATADHSVDAEGFLFPGRRRGKATVLGDEFCGSDVLLRCIFFVLPIVGFPSDCQRTYRPGTLAVLDTVLDVQRPYRQVCNLYSFRAVLSLHNAFCAL
jgi:hypothetical protein